MKQKNWHNRPKGLNSGTYIRLLLSCLFNVIVLTAQEKVFSSEWQLVTGGLNFPEGPAWGENGLYISNCYSDWIAHWCNGRLDTLRLRDADSIRTNGLFYYHGTLYACDFKGRRIICIQPDGGWSSLTTNTTLHRPNDLTFDSRGDLYFTDSGEYNREQPNGGVWRIQITTSRRVTQILTDLAFPNGIVFSPDGAWLYVAESARQIVVRYPCLPDGQLGPGKEFIAMPGGDPDGMACDEKGNIYVAHFGGGYVWVIAPDGTIVTKIKTPGRKPSNLEFGGSDPHTLFLTETETNALYTIRTVYRGAARY